MMWSYLGSPSSTSSSTSTDRTTSIGSLPQYFLDIYKKREARLGSTQALFPSIVRPGLRKKKINSERKLGDRVGRLGMIAQVESHLLAILGSPQTDRKIDHLENQRRDDC